MDTKNQEKLYDFVVIGSGIVGANIVRELAKYSLSILLLEKESDVVNGQTLANSGIIHSGHDPLEGTLKAQLCVEGNALAHKLSKELDFHLLECGGLVLAFSKEEEVTLHELYNNALANHVPHVKLLDRRELLKREPNINKDVLMGLDLPTTTVCSPWEMALASVENAILNGVEVKVDSRVDEIKYIDDHYEITVNGNSKIHTSRIINAAGINSEVIARLVEEDVEFKIKPRRGEYFTLDPKNKGFFNSVLYPLPTSLGKGVLITPQVHGETLVGPTSEDISDGRENLVTSEGLHKIITDAKRISPNIPFGTNIRNFAGVRAKSSYEDFYIKESKTCQGFYHVAGIDSPGLTAAPAIANYLIEMIKKDVVLVPKANYISGRNYQPLFRYLAKEEKIAAIKQNPLHGHIVCKCENITEADIVNAINGVSGADTVKAVKKRTRAGAGICQGGYCERHVLALIAKHKNMKMTEINYYEADTPILLEDIKRDQQ